MALAVITVDAGGIPVTEATNGVGTPVIESTNGFGLAVTVVEAGGLAVVGLETAEPPEGGAPTYHIYFF
jgi:hypothetical protein